MRAFVGVPAFIAAIVLMWPILSRELREQPVGVRGAPLPAWSPPMASATTGPGMPIAVLDGRFGV